MTQSWAIGGRALALAGGALVPALLVGAAEPAAAAPTISARTACVTPGQRPNGEQVARSLTVLGRGFGPGANIEVRRGAYTVATQAGPTGDTAAQLDLDDLLVRDAPRAVLFRVRATDLGGRGGSPAPLGPSNVLTLRAAPLTFSVAPAVARPAQRVTFRFSGFRPGRTIFAHYLYRGRVRATVPMVRAAGPCGTGVVRRPQHGVSDPQAGTWRVQFDQTRRFSPTARPRVTATTTVTLVAQPPR